MALFNIDLLGVIAQLRRDTKLFQWIALLFQIAVSMTGSFLITCGATLSTVAIKYGAALAWPIGVGVGMISAATTLAVFARRSPLLKGMMFMFPATEAQQEIQTDIQVIQR